MSNLLIITEADVITIDNDGYGYCLIKAFFQGLHSDQGRLQDSEKQKLISEAMKMVVDNEEFARDVLTEQSKMIIATWYDKYKNICQGLPLKSNEYWNYEILEFFIEISQLKVQIYYFREFVTKQYVLLKTRKSMDRKEGIKVVTILENLKGHKLLIAEFQDNNKLSEKLSVEDLLDNTNFDCLIDDREVCTPYDLNTFISLDICRKVIVARDATCGYASIAKSIGKNVEYIMELLSEHYLNEVDESSDSELFGRGRKLTDWLSNKQSEPLPEELSIILDDGV